LIDPDMIPSFASADVDQVVQEFQRTRLIEITGAWAGLAQSTEALNRIFDTFDKVKTNTGHIARCDFDDLTRSVVMSWLLMSLLHLLSLCLLLRPPLSSGSEGSARPRRAALHPDRAALQLGARQAEGDPG
jgi:hypothetical protein